MKTSFRLNGKSVAWELDPGISLRDALRAKGIVSVRNGCDGEGACGLCAVLFDGHSVNSCQLLAVQADGHEIRTVDGLSKDRELSIVQRALVDAACVQCGYCTPAVALAIQELLERIGILQPSRAAIADALSGTMCRCTGYEQFFNAVRIAVDAPVRARLRRSRRARVPSRPAAHRQGSREGGRGPPGPRRASLRRGPRRRRRLPPQDADEPPRPCVDQRPSTRRPPRPCPASSPS